MSTEYVLIVPDSTILSLSNIQTIWLFCSQRFHYDFQLDIDVQSNQLFQQLIKTVIFPQSVAFGIPLIFEDTVNFQALLFILIVHCSCCSLNCESLLSVNNNCDALMTFVQYQYERQHFFYYFLQQLHSRFLFRYPPLYQIVLDMSFLRRPSSHCLFVSLFVFLFNICHYNSV